MFNVSNPKTLPCTVLQPKIASPLPFPPHVSLTKEAPDSTSAKLAPWWRCSFTSHRLAAEPDLSHHEFSKAAVVQEITGINNRNNPSREVATFQTLCGWGNELKSCMILVAVFIACRSQKPVVIRGQTTTSAIANCSSPKSWCKNRSVSAIISYSDMIYLTILSPQNITCLVWTLNHIGIAWHSYVKICFGNKSKQYTSACSGTYKVCNTLCSKYTVIIQHICSATLGYRTCFTAKGSSAFMAAVQAWANSVSCTRIGSFIYLFLSLSLSLQHHQCYLITLIYFLDLSWSFLWSRSKTSHSHTPYL